MTADDLTTAIVCGAREQRDGYTYECVRQPKHDGEAHIWFKLVQRPNTQVSAAIRKPVRGKVGAQVKSGPNQSVCAPGPGLTPVLSKQNGG